MASVLEIQINGNPAGLKSAISDATGSISSFSKNSVGLLAKAEAALKSYQQKAKKALDPQVLAGYNEKIQQTQAEIGRLSNVGKTGFDSLGNAINGSTNLAGKAFSSIRQLAYILPGVGVAGLIGFATGPIIEYISSLDLLNSKLSQSTENQNALNEVNKAADQDAGKQITNLKILYTAATDVTLSTKERTKAAEELKKQFPDAFSNSKTLAILNGNEKKTYDDLTVSILANARARAAADKIAEIESKRLDIAFQKQKIQNANANEKARAKPKQLRDESGTVVVDISADDVKKASDYRAKQALDIQESQDKILKGQSDFLTKYIGNEKLATAVTTKPLKTKTKTQTDKVAPLANASDNKADLAGLIGNDREVEEIRQRYVKLYAAIDTESKKSGANQDVLSKQRSDAQANEAKEIGVVIIQEQTRVANEIQRINNESGVKSSENREQDLARIQKWYDDQVTKAQGNAAILAAIETGKQTQIQAAIDKWEAKRVDAQQNISDKIQDISDKEFTLNDNNSSKVSKRIDEELAKRLKSLSDYFDDLKKLYKDNPLALTALGAAQTEITKQVVSKANTAKNPAAAIFDKDLQQSVERFGSDFIRTLSSINQQADQSFKGIFSSLAGQLTHSLDDVFTKQLTGILTKALSSASSEFGKLSSSQQGIVAGIGVAGGLVSGATKQTSSLGQAAGGALTGGAAGFAVGGPIGAAIGGVIGGIAGIFGASKAKKQEALQEAQLAEQKKQTALQERANALAYTSSIIGRMTTQGVVTGVEVNEFGQLTTKISGNDIAVVLDRANSSRSRGV